MSRNDCNNNGFGCGCQNKNPCCRCSENSCTSRPCHHCCPGPQGPPGPAGATGAMGPSGPQGATGAAGATILGSYENYNSFITAHPTGTAGDAYLVGGELYVWQASSQSWQNMGSLVGPMGPQGEPGMNGINGANGADGVIGQIDGIVATVVELPSSGVTQGTIYYVEENGSLYVWDDNEEWVLLNVAQGPRGATGPQGPQGPQGPSGTDGIIGPIQGVVATVAELPSSGVTQGTIYYVENDGLYVWDEARGEWIALGMVQGPRGEQGEQGEQGEPGPAASSYMMIPFASGEAPMTYSNNGNPSRVSLLGFGYGDRRDEGTLDAANYSVPIDPSNYSFTLAGNGNKQVVFSLPFDVSIRSLYITVGNWGSFTTDYPVFPYVQLFSAAPGTNNFTAIPDAFAIPTQGIGPGVNVPADTMRSAFKNGLDIKLSAGTRIGIGAMMQLPGSTDTVTRWLYFTGGIGLSYEPSNI